MRKVIDLQMEFWKKDIANIEFDLQSRDEIPKLLMGRQYIYRTASIREKIFEVLKQIVPKKGHETGRVAWDEKIPHEEKVFSIFEPHTEWISKGKALGILTHKLGRAIYFMLKNKEAFNMKRFFAQ